MLAELDSLELLCTATRQHPRAMVYEDIAGLTYTHNAIRVCQPAPQGFPLLPRFYTVREQQRQMLFCQH